MSTTELTVPALIVGAGVGRCRGEHEGPFRFG
jgi:hypothetical protein